MNNNGRAMRGGIKHQDSISSISKATGWGSNSPDFDKIADDGSGSTGVNANFFDGSYLEEVYSDNQMWHGIVQGRDMPFHYHWAPTTNPGAGEKIVLGVEYIIWPIGTVLDTSGTTLVKTTIQVESYTAWEHVLSEIVDIDLSTNLGVSTTILYRFFRDAGDANDTYGHDIVLIYGDGHMPLFDRGSINEYSVEV